MVTVEVYENLDPYNEEWSARGYDWAKDYCTTSALKAVYDLINDDYRLDDASVLHCEGLTGYFINAYRVDSRWWEVHMYSDDGLCFDVVDIDQPTTERP